MKTKKVRQVYIVPEQEQFEMIFDQVIELLNRHNVKHDIKEVEIPVTLFEFADETDNN